LLAVPAGDDMPMFDDEKAQGDQTEKAQCPGRILGVLLGGMRSSYLGAGNFCKEL